MTPDEYQPLATADVVRGRLKEWFAQLQQRVREGEKYVLCYPNTPHELFEAMDIPFVVDAWYSGLAAAKRLGGHYSEVLEENEYHAGLLRYMATPLASFLDEDDVAPWGGLELPGLVVSSATNDQGSALSQHFDVPHFAFVVPAESDPSNHWWERGRYDWEAMTGSERIDFVVDEFRELIDALERMSGRRLDLGRLREVMDRVSAQLEHLRVVRDLMAHAPKLPARLGEVTTITMGVQWHRGTEWALEASAAFRREVEERVAHERWVCPGERHRLMWLGTGLWQNQRFLDTFEKDHDTVFVRSNYISLAADGYSRDGAADPLRALASRYASHGADNMHQPGPGSGWALHEAREHRIDGAVLVGQWWGGSRLIARDLAAAGIPVMTLEADSLGTGSMRTEDLTKAVARFIETEVAS